MRKETKVALYVSWLTQELRAKSQFAISFLCTSEHSSNIFFASTLFLLLRSDLISTQGPRLCEVDFGAASQVVFGGAQACQ